jgi:hypothetical protein
MTARWPLLHLVMLAMTLWCACSPLAPTRVEAPAWEPVAFSAGSDADFVGAMDLRAIRQDPLFGPLLQHFARRNDLAVLLRASQIDLVASVERGEPRTWIAIVHGVDGRPTRSDVGSIAPDVLTAPGTWILGEGAAFDRVRSGAGLNPTPIAMPSRALVASTLQGHAVPDPERDELGDMTQGLVEMSGELLAGAHLELVMQCRYSDATAARHAAAAARLVLLAVAARTDLESVLTRALTKIDFDVSGDVVAVRVTISDDLREVLESYVERASDR